MEQTPKVTAREIIETIIEAMHAGIEPLAYTALAPSIYQVHLCTEDHERLCGIFPRIIDEAKKKLNEELTSLNAAPKSTGLFGRLKRRWERGPQQLVYQSAEGDWYISFHENTDEDDAGAFNVTAELTLPLKFDAIGASTKRITFRRTGDGETRRIRQSVEPPPASHVHAPSAPAGTDENPAYATLTYEDDHGQHVYKMTKSQIVIGRGGIDYWVDVRLSTSEDVSREHLRLRRDAGTGKFYIKDLSTLGTAVNGERIASSVINVN